MTKAIQHEVHFLATPRSELNWVGSAIRASAGLTEIWK